MMLPVKSPDLVSVFIEASMNLKSIFLDNLDTKNLKPSAHLQNVMILFLRSSKNESSSDTVPSKS
jgi:hypothetical protein